ncbi:MAG: hypothetical protein K9N46_07110 [Candidatus Marinimicrobia bacterium]|nr:hypothetical protein [Candidatus Neomarinimicrobiota bacterium]MCF7880490.1 hypothetical protein [Candidatus Neomarinimicrobiota bacterium]
MEENSFMPLDQITQQDGEEVLLQSRNNKILKKGSVTKKSRRVIQHEEQHSSRNFECKPVMENGVVIAIDIQCDCGNEERITLEYESTE